jgi:hypothetical protein
MRKLLGLVAAAAVAFGAAGVASARPLNFTGTIKAQIAALPELGVSGGGVATVNGTSTTLPAHLNTLRIGASRGLVTGTDTNIITDPEVAGNGIAAIIVNFQPRTGTLAPISGAISAPIGLSQNQLAVGGIAKLCLLSTVCTDFLPLLLTAPTTNGARYNVGTATPNQLTPLGTQGKRLGVPGTGVKGLGIGGLVTVGGFSAVRISLEAAPWTVKTATAIDQTDDNTGAAAFHNVTRMGFAHGAASGTTSTANVSGVVQIVTPNQVRTNLSLGSNEKVAALAELVIRFIPEPGLLLLIGSGVVGLAVIGRSRMRG